MPNDGPAEKRIFQAALQPGDCPPIEQLEKLLMEGSAPPAALAAHVESCAFCRTEVQLLREFQGGSPRETEAAAVQSIASRLRARSSEIFKPERASVDARQPWWRLFWSAPWFTPAALAFVGILAVVAVGLQTRSSSPALHSPGTNGTVFRSNAIVVTAPSGDIRQAPSEIRWQTDPGAVKYEVRLFEVDGAELWRTETYESAVQLPAPIRARIVPAKALLCQVLAFDATGHQVAISERVRFRVSPKPYQP
jgi:hypothetical protein